MFLPHFFVSSCPGYIPYRLYRNMERESISIYMRLYHRHSMGEDNREFDFVPVCLTLSRNVSRYLTMSHRFPAIIPVVSACLIYIAFPMHRPPARFRPAPLHASRHAQRGAAYLLAYPSRPPRCPSSFLVVLPNLVCVLCGSLQVVYIDWNIGYYGSCQEGNDGHAVR